MGNNQSHSTNHVNVDVVKKPPSRPSELPSGKLTSDLGPNGPSYHSPENMVLPKELPSMMKLRPVSMELSKYRPEYGEIFQHEANNNLETEAEGDDVNVNSDGMPSSPKRPPQPVLNGHVPSSPSNQNNLPVSQLPNGHAEPKQNNNNKNVGKSPYRPSHRRQLSLTTNLTGQEHTIHEEPEESIDDRFKLDPLMQSFPGAIGPSLPVKNNFNLDYSYQCTYVQLAEHRRNKTIEDLEKKTGKKLSDLTNDLSENAQDQFNRNDISRQSSKSLGNGISSKKKRAPAPPQQAPSLLPGNTQSLPRSLPNSPRGKVTNGQYSFENEPPADYDLAESPRHGFILPRYTAASFVSQGHQSRSNSMKTRPISMPPVRTQSMSPGRSSAVPPPPPPPAPPLPPSVPPQPSAQSVGAFAKRNPNVNVSRNNSMNASKPELILKKTPTIKPSQKEESNTQVPWLLQLKSVSESMALKRQQSMEDTSVPPPLAFKDNIEDNTVGEADKEIQEHKTKMVFQTSKEEFVPGKPKSETPEAKTPESPKLLRSSSASSLENQLSPPSSSPQLKRQTSFPATSSIADPSRRLSSLLQHDIKSAANAKCIKLVKQTTPTPPKPKDPHQVFREQLQKASAEREKRVEKTGSIDEVLQRMNSVDNQSQDDAQSVKSGASLTKEENKGPETLPKPPRYHKNVTVNRNMSAAARGQSRFSRQDENTSTKGSRQSMEWTPEDDLDSDDNLSDREEMTLRRGAQDGFKSTIVPNTMTNMKGAKKSKSKPKKKAESFSVDEQNRNKFGSVKKLKKSVHKGVKNAFGSISKASGKILRRQRSEELEVVQDAPKNWKLSNGTSQKKSTDRSYKYVVPDDYQLDDSDSDDTGGKVNENDHEFSEVVFRNGTNHVADMTADDTSDDDEDDDDSVDKSPKQVKRAGVAYISAKGKLLLVQDDNSLKRMKADEAKKAAAKSKQKKKKAKEESVENEIEKQRRLEEERRKQLEMELAFHKKREAETMERLQRLESAQMQQHINAQLFQQQQQQNVSMVSAPQLPPAGTYPPNYATMPDPAQSQPFANMFGHQIPQNTFQGNYGVYQTPGSFNLGGSMPGMPMDLNDYMRMLGVQNPPTSQQMAFFMNNMSFTGSQQPFERKSNPTLFNVINQTEPLKQFPTSSMPYQAHDTRRQGFQNWTSTPNIHAAVPMSTSVNIPISDFVTSYNGANTKNSDRDTGKKDKARNPLYDSDNSDEGLSPQRSIVSAQVKDFRPVNLGSESEKFMRKYGGGSNFSQTSNVANNGNGERTSLPIDLTQGYRATHRQRSVSPSTSMSTVDSAITSMSATVSPPSSPSKSTSAPESPVMSARSDTGSGFRTVLDLSSNTIQIDTLNGQTGSR